MLQRNITITPQRNAFVDAIPGLGRFGDANGILQAGLRPLEREESETKTKSALFHGELDKGLSAFRQGDYTVLDSPQALDAFFAGLEEEREQILANRDE